MSSSRLSRRASLRNATAAFDAADALNSIKKSAKRKGRPPKAKADPAPRANKKVVTAEAKAVVVAHIKANEPLDTSHGAANIADGDPQAQYGEIGYQWWLEPGSTTEEEDEEEEERPRAPDLEECLQDPMWCTEPCHNGCTNGEIFRAFKRAYIKYGATWPPDFERKRTRVRSRKAIAGLEAEWREREKAEQAKRPRKAKNVTAQDSVASFVSYDSCMSPSVPGSTCSDQEPSSDAEEFFKEIVDGRMGPTSSNPSAGRDSEEEDDAWDAEDEARQAGPSRPRWQRMQDDEDEGDMSGTLCDEDVVMGEAEDEDETMGDDESEEDAYDSDYEDTDYKGKGKQRAESVHHLRNRRGKGKARL